MYVTKLIKPLCLFSQMIFKIVCVACDRKDRHIHASYYIQWSSHMRADMALENINLNKGKQP
jgi:hypothetical protein